MVVKSRLEREEWFAEQRKKLRRREPQEESRPES
jgi:hypothetical protein